MFKQAELPRLFAGEDTQHMTSCWLTNFAEAQDSLVYVPTETVYFGRRLHITEKTFKAIALEMPFVLVAPAGSLEYMRSYGFKTFHNVFDESYDEERDDFLRIEKVVKLLHELNNLSIKERQQIHQACLPIVEYNYQHFYRGGFSNILWDELTTMLDSIYKWPFKRLDVNLFVFPKWQVFHRCNYPIGLHLKPVGKPGHHLVALVLPRRQFEYSPLSN